MANAFFEQAVSRVLVDGRGAYVGHVGRAFGERVASAEWSEIEVSMREALTRGEAEQISDEGKLEALGFAVGERRSGARDYVSAFWQAVAGIWHRETAAMEAE